MAFKARRAMNFQVGVLNIDGLGRGENIPRLFFCLGLVPEQWENYDQLLSRSRERMEEKKSNVFWATGSYGLVWSINVWKVTW